MTAAGGFSGSILVPFLVNQGYEVLGIYRSTVSKRVKSLEGDGLILYRCDLSQPIEIDWYPEIIIHNAGSIFGDKFPALDFSESNIEVTRNLIKFALRIGNSRFVYFSSISALGNISEGSVNEETMVQSPGPYGLSKLFGEHMLAEVGNQLASIALRLPGILGPGNQMSWLASVAAKVKAHDDIELFNIDMQFNNCIHIDDVCSFIMNAVPVMENGLDIVNLASTQKMRLFDIVAAIIQNSQSTSTIIDCGKKNGAFAIDVSKAMHKYSFNSMPISKLLKSLVES